MMMGRSDDGVARLTLMVGWTHADTKPTRAVMCRAVQGSWQRGVGRLEGPDG